MIKAPSSAEKPTWVATTTMPCTACMQTLCANGVREVYYREVYHRSDAPEIARLYGVKLERVDFTPFEGIPAPL